MTASDPRPPAGRTAHPFITASAGKWFEGTDFNYASSNSAVVAAQTGFGQSMLTTGPPLLPPAVHRGPRPPNHAAT